MAQFHIVKAPVSAKDLLRKDHPFRSVFEGFLCVRKTKETSRQARKFLQRHPEFKVVRIVIANEQHCGTTCCYAGQ